MEQYPLDWLRLFLAAASGFTGTSQSGIVLAPGSSITLIVLAIYMVSMPFLMTRTVNKGWMPWAALIINVWSLGLFLTVLTGGNVFLCLVSYGMLLFVWTMGFGLPWWWKLTNDVLMIVIFGIAVAITFLWGEPFTGQSLLQGYRDLAVTVRASLP